MIIFVGVAGSGKSMQGHLISQELNCGYFSMGEFLRSHPNEDIRNRLISGDLIEDEEVIKLVDDHLPTQKGVLGQYVLDGFPRTISQVEWLVSQVKAGRFNIDGVIHINASPEVVVKRLLERHRPDDHMEAIQHRIDEYNETVLPILNALKADGMLICEINGEQAIEDVHKDIMRCLKPNLK